MARLIDAEKLKEMITARVLNTGTTYGSSPYHIMQIIDEAPTAFDVEILMKKIATLDRIAKSDKQKALLGRVFFIIENMIEENERGQKNDTDTADSTVHD